VQRRHSGLLTKASHGSIFDHVAFRRELIGDWRQAEPFDDDETLALLVRHLDEVQEGLGWRPRRRWPRREPAPPAAASRSRCQNGTVWTQSHVDVEPELAQRFGVWSMPNLLV